MGSTSLAWTGGVYCIGQVAEEPLRVPDAPVTAGASVDTAATVGEFGDARLEQLIGRQAEEIRNAVEVLDLHGAFGGQDLTEPHRAASAPVTQVLLVLMAGPQEGANILGEHPVGFHLRVVNTYHRGP